MSMELGALRYWHARHLPPPGIGAGRQHLRGAGGAGVRAGGTTLGLGG